MGREVTLGQQTPLSKPYTHTHTHTLSRITQEHTHSYAVLICGHLSVGEKREALLAEIVRLEGDPEGREADAGAPPLQPCRGSINISEVHLPLKVDFVCSARNGNQHVQ